MTSFLDTRRIAPVDISHQAHNTKEISGLNILQWAFSIQAFSVRDLCPDKRILQDTDEEYLCVSLLLSLFL